MTDWIALDNAESAQRAHDAAHEAVTGWRDALRVAGQVSCWQHIWRPNTSGGLTCVVCCEVIDEGDV
jgi:hypothetical protein